MPNTTRHHSSAAARTALIALVALVLAACSDSDATPTPPPSATAEATSTPAGEATAAAEPREVEWGRCGFAAPAGVVVECGVLEVPAQRQEPQGGEIRLHFGVVRTESATPVDDPLVFLAGGPGQGALGFVPLAYQQLYAPLVADRDLVILDQRGTGLSEPSLRCDEYIAWIRDTLGSGRPPEELAAEATQVLEDCRQRLAGEGIDFSAYNSAESAADLDDLRRALGYERWNLYGTSYGTRLALTAMRDFPDGIRSVVLDAAYPVEADLYGETPANAARAFEAFFGACEGDAACAARFPDLEQTFTDLVAELNAAPVHLMVVEPQTGRRLESELSGDGLVAFLFQSLYATELLPFLPEIIAAAAAGNVGTIGLLQGAFMTQLELVSTGMQLAVQCHEEVPFGDRDAVVAAASEQGVVLEGLFERSPTLGAGIFDLCERWGGGTPAAIENEPVVSDIPALVLAGELDPITPPRWGEAIASRLPNSHFFTFPFTGHGTVAAHECAALMTQAFLADPTAEPDSTCIADIPPPAFTSDAAEVTMTPFDHARFVGLRPEGWTEVLPGVYQESALVALAQVAAPGATRDLLLAQVAGQLGADAPPTPVGQHESPFLTWDLYELEDLGQSVDLALAEHEGALYLVQFSSTPERRDAYYDEVFRAAIEALDPKP